MRGLVLTKFYIVAIFFYLILPPPKKHLEINFFQNNCSFVLLLCLFGMETLNDNYGVLIVKKKKPAKTDF